MGQKNQRGVAILAVLLGIALMTLVVVDFAMTSGVGFVSAANQANEMRAGYLARSGISVALGLLAADARAKSQTQTQSMTNSSSPSQSPGVNQSQAPTQSPSGSQTACESLSDAWAAPFPPMAVDGGTVTLSIVDEARKLNINNMIVQTGPQAGTSNPIAIAKIQRLFTILDVDTDLVPGIIQWITPSSASGIGGESNFYMGLIPPYQPRNGPMPTIADLQMVQGFGGAIFNRVSPFLTVLPEPLVNANTASPQVIAALEPELMEDEKLVQEIVEARPFTKTTDITNLAGVSSSLAPRLSKDVTTRSQYFTITGMGAYAGARKIITATFQRQTNGVGLLDAWNED